jgi:uncharacterized membrane protein
MTLVVRPRIYFHRLLKEWIIPRCSNRNNSTNKSPAVLFLVVLSLVVLFLVVLFLVVLFLVVLSLVVLSLMMLFPGVLFPVQGFPICRITTPIPFPE